MTLQRLEQQLRFAVEADRLKNVVRQTVLADGSRQENSAEHSWHIALMAFLLAEHAGETVDIGRVTLMLLLHDLVEIDAGDTFAYDAPAQVDKARHEQAAADRIFGLLPPEQAARFRMLWEEFEQRATPEARFANALDRLQPILLNYHSGGAGWRRWGVSVEQVLERNRPIADGAPDLWEHARELIDEARSHGWVQGGADLD